MSESRAPDRANRPPAIRNRIIPDPPDGADPQMAAGFLPGPAPTVVFPNAQAVAPGSATAPGQAGLAPVVSGQWSVVSVGAPAAGGPVGSPVGPETTLVVQGTDPVDGRGRVIRIDSEATDLAAAIDVFEPIAGPPVPPVVDPTVDREPRAIPEEAGRPAAIPVGAPASWAIDAALEELAVGAGPVLAGDGGAVAPVAIERVRLEGSLRRTESPRERGGWPWHLAAVLLAAGWPGQRRRKPSAAQSAEILNRADRSRYSRS